MFLILFNREGIHVLVKLLLSVFRRKNFKTQKDFLRVRSRHESDLCMMRKDDVIRAM